MTVGVIDTGLHGAQAIPERAAVTETVSTPGAEAIGGDIAELFFKDAVTEAALEADWTLAKRVLLAINLATWAFMAVCNYYLC